MASGGAPGFKGRPARNSWRVRAVPRGQWRAAVPRVLRKARTVAAPVRTPPIFPPVVRHLYVHIPFCIRRCSYCDFSIAVRKRVPGSEYVHAVLRELDLLRDSPGWANPAAMPRGPKATGTHLPSPRGPKATELESLYLGGGTPSLLPASDLSRLIASLFDVVHSKPSRDDVEVTLEAIPEDVTPESARAWRSAGVNRVSLGAQSFDDRVLQWMHRSHDAARIGDAVRTLRAAGIENISLDLIFR